jgi:hypothetical protein
MRAAKSFPKILHPTAKEAGRWLRLLKMYTVPVAASYRAAYQPIWRKLDMDSYVAAHEAAIAEFLTTELATTFTPFSAVASPRLNVSAIAIGKKYKKKVATDQQCVQFYVEKKLPKEAIAPQFLLPEVYHRVPTDVIESGRFLANPVVQPQVAHGPITRRFRPIQPGGSCGFQFPGGSGMLMAGTLGCLAVKGNQTCILSNNHVLANENALPLGSPIFQPGLLDGGSSGGDAIAKLSQFVEIQAGAGNLVDCAIAVVDDGIAVDATFLPKVAQLSNAAPVTAANGTAVEKVGRTTGFTTGVVSAIGVALTVQYSFGAAIFRNQVFIQGANGPFSAAGDSGSVIVGSDSRQATALLFAGSDQFTAANPMDAVLAALGITLKA